VALAFTGGVTVFTGTDGTYLATLPPGYSGVVTVSHPGYLLTPAARSYSQLPPVLSGEDYSAQFQPGAPEIVSPLPGSTFGSGTVTFQWMINPCSTQYFLALGSTPAGSDLFNDDAGTAGTLTVNGLPADGRTIYARFFSRIGGEFRYNDYVFTAADASQPPAPAQLLSPAPGPLDQGSITFRWSPGRGVSQYYLAIGKQLGGNDLANLDQGTAQSATVSGLPGDGSRIYVRLQSRIGQEWQSSDYVYTLPSGPETGKAEMVSPPGMVALCSTSATFQWSAGRNVSQYFMAIGSGPAGNDLFNIDLGTSLSRTIDGLPADGRTLYVRLFSLIGSTWFFNDYLYAAAAR
jgi:hypothetical protein